MWLEQVPVADGEPTKSADEIVRAAYRKFGRNERFQKVVSQVFRETNRQSRQRQ
jgi:hypothetical protein